MSNTIKPMGLLLWKCVDNVQPHLIDKKKFVINEKIQQTCTKMVMKRLFEDLALYICKGYKYFSTCENI
jgi:hypothetical protein